MRDRWFLWVTMALVIQSPFSFAQGSGGSHETGGSRGQGGPPQEAFDACTGQSEQAQCSVQTPRGEIMKGICLNPPQQEQLICVPEEHLRGGGMQQQGSAPQGEYNQK